MIIRNVLIAISLGLSLLVVVQWTRESSLRKELSGMDVRLISSEAETSDLKDKVRSWGEEITRLTELNKTAESKAEEQKQEIARLTGILQARDAAEATASASASPGGPTDVAATLKARNEEVIRQNEATTKLNEAVTRQNASLQKLVRERDDLVDKLNARTRELNELTLKYNKLAKQS